MPDKHSYLSSGKYTGSSDFDCFGFDRSEQPAEQKVHYVSNANSSGAEQVLIVLQELLELGI